MRRESTTSLTVCYSSVYGCVLTIPTLIPYTSPPACLMYIPFLALSIHLIYCLFMCRTRKRMPFNELLPGMVTSSEEALICKLASYNINFWNQRVASIVTTADSRGYNKKHAVSTHMHSSHFTTTTTRYIATQCHTSY